MPGLEEFDKAKVKMIIPTVLLGLFVVLLFKWMWDRKKAHNLFKEMGIPGPEPSLLLGNMNEIMKHGRHPSIENWQRKYGTLYGFYEGTHPVLVSSDIEMVKQFCIKEFSKFSNREAGAFSKPSSDKHVNMVFANGDQWKRLRSVASPTFSAKKMKEMSPLVNDCLTNFLELLDKHAEDGKPFNMHGEYQRFTLDTIASCAFGIESSAIKDVDSTFIKQAREVMGQLANVKLSIKILMLTKYISPGLFEILRHFFNPPSDPVWFYSLARSVMEQRQNDNTKNARVDFIQLMLNVKVMDTDVSLMGENVDNDITNANTEDTKTQPQKGKGMTPEEIESQCATFLLAGYETTSVALGFISYELALNPDVQDKLREEIFEHFPDPNVHADYLSVQKLEYLDMVLKETLRIHSPAASTKRNCGEACTIKGIQIPKNMTVTSNICAIHMDPDLWGPEDCNLFIPERFTAVRRAGRDPLAWMPFGTGPRNCIGMRFALLEVKIAMVRILKNYIIHQCPETQVPVPVQTNFFRGPVNGIMLRLSFYHGN